MNVSAPVRMVWSVGGWRGKFGRLDLIEKKDEYVDEKVEYGSLGEETRRIKRPI